MSMVSPIMAGKELVYPFIPELHTAMLATAGGMTLRQSMVATAAILGPCLV